MVRVLGHDRGDRRGVDAAGEEHARLDVPVQAHAHGFVQQAAILLDGFALIDPRLVLLDERQIPISPAAGALA